MKSLSKLTPVTPQIYISATFLICFNEIQFSLIFSHDVTFAKFPFNLVLFSQFQNLVNNLFLPALCVRHLLSLLSFHLIDQIFREIFPLNSAAKRLCDGQRIWVLHCHLTGQERGYFFVLAFITENMSLNLVVCKRQGYTEVPTKCSFKHNFESPSCD